jgi:hypothetical protein
LTALKIFNTSTGSRWEHGNRAENLREALSSFVNRLDLWWIGPGLLSFTSVCEQPANRQLSLGKRLFPEGTDSSLKLVDSKAFSSGVVALTYQPSKK